LTSLNLKLQLLIEQLATGRHNAHETHAELLKIYQTTQHMLNQIRELSLDLRPALLEDFGLIPALITLFDRTREQLSLVIDFKHSGILDRRFPPLIEITVYRIIQEALTNIARHAGVGEAKVRLWAEGNQISFQIEDQGRGFDKEKALSMTSTSTGLVGIQERVKHCRGRLSIETHPGEGTCITVELPLEKA